MSEINFLARRVAVITHQNSKSVKYQFNDKNYGIVGIVVGPVDGRHEVHKIIDFLTFFSSLRSVKTVSFWSQILDSFNNISTFVLKSQYTIEVLSFTYCNMPYKMEVVAFDTRPRMDFSPFNFKRLESLVQLSPLLPIILLIIHCHLYRNIYSHNHKVFDLSFYFNCSFKTNIWWE